MKLLSNGVTNAKTKKNELRSFIMYLAPANLSGKNTCPNASPECIQLCLNTAGMGVFSNVQLARIAKTEFLWKDRKGFYTKLLREISNANKLAKRKGEKFAIRLNGTSDIDHIQLLKNVCGVDVLTAFDNLVFYDYTKNINHIKRYLNTNYHLTFSLSEINKEKALQVLEMGVNVAVVFTHKKPLPSEFMGRKVINGDNSDFRPNDEKGGNIVGLIAKGKAKKPQFLGGFVN